MSEALPQNEVVALDLPTVVSAEVIRTGKSLQSRRASPNPKNSAGFHHRAALPSIKEDQPQQQQQLAAEDTEEQSNIRLALHAVLELRKHLTMELSRLVSRMDKIESSFCAVTVSSGQFKWNLEQQILKLSLYEEEKREQLSRVFEEALERERHALMQAANEFRAFLDADAREPAGLSRSQRAEAVDAAVQTVEALAAQTCAINRMVPSCSESERMLTRARSTQCLDMRVAPPSQYGHQPAVSLGSCEAPRAASLPHSACSSPKHAAVLHQWKVDHPPECRSLLVSPQGARRRFEPTCRTSSLVAEGSPKHTAATAEGRRSLGGGMSHSTQCFGARVLAAKHSGMPVTPTQTGRASVLAAIRCGTTLRFLDNSLASGI